MRLLAANRSARPVRKSIARLTRAVEVLERRVMLNATLTSPINELQLSPNAPAATVDLSMHFTDPTITGSPVVIETSQGNIFLNLFSQQAPKTVANFLNYADNGAYDQTVIQRAVPGFILQGGGFLSDQSHIPTGAPVANEAGTSNTTGTIAMALNTDPNTHQVDPNSATSDWFINDANNTQLDAQKFTVFGQVVYNSMAVVNAIEALPKGAVSPTFLPNVNAGDPAGGVLPLQNYNDGAPILTSNYVTVTLVRSFLPLNFTVSSDNTALLDAGVSGETLTLTPHAGSGLAHVNIIATDVAGNVAQTTLTVQVGNTQAVLGAGAAKLVRFTDPDGTTSQISFAGAGTATVSFSGTNLMPTTKGNVITLSGTPQGVFIATTGTNAGSSLTITGKGGNGTVDIAGMTTDGSLRALIGNNTALTGNMNAAGSIGSLSLATLGGGSITLGAGQGANIKIGTVNNASIFSAAPISSLTAGSWASGGTINAPSIGKVTVKGAFLGTVASSSIKSFAAGSITGGSWNITGAVSSVVTHAIAGLTASLGSLGKLTALGAVSSSIFRSSGNIGAVSTGGISNSSFFAGVGSASLPSAPTDFSAAASIGSVSVKGSFVNGNIAAQSLGKLALGAIQSANAGIPFGVAAFEIKQLQARVDGTALKLANVTTDAQVAAAFTAQKVTPGDLAIRML
jgi:peptidyl-prolyl cis-trans isomerase A (cyclophilin A)